MRIPRTHPHMLRHIRLSRFDAGVDLRDVQIAARHADPEPPCVMTEPARTSPATPTTSSPPTWHRALDQVLHHVRSYQEARLCRDECCAAWESGRPGLRRTGPAWLAIEMVLPGVGISAVAAGQALRLRTGAVRGSRSRRSGRPPPVSGRSRRARPGCPGWRGRWRRGRRPRRRRVFAGTASAPAVR